MIHRLRDIFQSLILNIRHYVFNHHRRISFSLLVVILTILVSNSWVQGIADSSVEPEPTPVVVVKGLVYIEESETADTIQYRVAELQDSTIDSVSKTKTLGQEVTGGGCYIHRLHASPRGPWVAVQWNCEDGARVHLLNGASGDRLTLNPELTSDSFFLNWDAGNNDIILRIRAGVDPQVVRVSVPNGKTTPLSVPPTTYNVALNKNGKQMVFATHLGLGTGSHVWLMDMKSGQVEELASFPDHIAAQFRWSPNGEQIAFILLEDTTTPFSIGELWVMDADGTNERFLAGADGGHGFPIYWSQDGSRLFFVQRENTSDPSADVDPTALLSNLYEVHLLDGSVDPLTTFTESLIEEPALSPDGSLIAFTRIKGQHVEVWVFDLTTGQVDLLPTARSARHPACLIGTTP